MNNLHPFEKLTPELIMDAIESQGHLCNGSVFAMNSYENRVYQIGIEDESQPIIAKFYRPNRWSKAQIQEEHDFCFELLEHDISVVVPLKMTMANHCSNMRIFYLPYSQEKAGMHPN